MQNCLICLFLAAADHGDRDGFFWLGWCYFHGDGCQKDIEKAKQLYSRAAEQGFVNADYELGHILHAEGHVDQFRYILRAASFGLGHDILGVAINNAYCCKHLLFALGREARHFLQVGKRKVRCLFACLFVYLLICLFVYLLFLLFLLFFFLKKQENRSMTMKYCSESRCRSKWLIKFVLLSLCSDLNVNLLEWLLMNGQKLLAN